MPVDKALEVWTAQTLCNIGILFSIASFVLHLGRPYFDRILVRFTLRVAADMWWGAYILVRDGSLFIAALLGFVHLNLDLMAEIKVGLPFVPLGTVALVAALLLKTLQNTEDLNRAYLKVVGLVSVGAFLNIIGYVLVMEAPGHAYAAARSVPWIFLHSLRSNVNPALATATFYVCLAMLAALTVFGTVKSFRQLRRAVEGGPGAKT